VSDRPSQHPTDKLAPVPVIPRAPRAPLVDGPQLADGAVVPVAEESPPASIPTSPPPPVFTELQRMSRRPSPVPPPPSSREDARHHDSRSFTLPGPYAIPKLIVESTDLSWFELNDDTRGIVPFIDGTRTIAEIARERGIPPREAQLRLADLRARGIIELS
jgi:hypothetical protein